MEGDICCSVEKWCGLVNKLTNPQRDKLSDIEFVRCMLDIPSIKMRTILVSYLIQAYDLKTNKFVLQGNTGQISATKEDVYSIFGFENQGFDVEEILDQEGDDAAEAIPVRFLDIRTKILVIDDLINNIVESGDTDDDFVRRVVLVLLGTIIAPRSTKIIPKSYYALVQDINRMRKLNLNDFTLRRCIEGIILVKKGKVIRHWPKGNVALLQVQTADLS